LNHRQFRRSIPSTICVLPSWVISITLSAQKEGEKPSIFIGYHLRNNDQGCLAERTLDVSTCQIDELIWSDGCQYMPLHSPRTRSCDCTVPLRLESKQCESVFVAIGGRGNAQLPNKANLAEQTIAHPLGTKLVTVSPPPQIRIQTFLIVPHLKCWILPAILVT